MRLSLLAGWEANSCVGTPLYVCYRPERTLLYQLVEEHYYPAFRAQLAAPYMVLPAYVEQEFEAYLKCGRLEHGFLRVRCDRAGGVKPAREKGDRGARGRRHHGDRRSVRCR